MLLKILNQTEILIFDTLEHEFLAWRGDGSMLILMRLAQIITCGLILGANVSIIIFIMNQGSKTFLDWLIVFDCSLCLSDLRIIILILNYSDFVDFCIYHVFLTFFTSLCNRLLSLGIAIYRLILVLGSTYMFSASQKKVLEKTILLAILLISLILTGWAIYYREDNRHFLSKVIFERYMYLEDDVLLFCFSVFRQRSRVFLQFL